jgi:hypothetical protein
MVRLAESKTIQGLLLEQRGDCYILTYAGVQETYQITAAGVRQVDCSDRGVWPNKVSEYVTAWCKARAKEKATGDAAAQRNQPLDRAS